MPAPFAQQLAGLRKAGGNPNTSDNNDTQSVDLGREMMLQLGLRPDDIGPEDPGKLMEKLTLADFRSRRPDLFIDSGQKASLFAQYAHLGVYPHFLKEYAGPAEALARLDAAINGLEAGQTRTSMIAAAANVRSLLEREASLVDQLIGMMPEESLLRIDLVVGEFSPDGLPPLLSVGLSAKWSLRTDRAQDCVSQGSKLVTLRRGRMPHFAVVTMEPRPAMLKLVADGSGAIDCVYHLDLPALTRTVEACAKRSKNPAKWSPKLTFDRLLRQGRLRDYDDLVAEVLRVPSIAPPPSAAASAP